MKLVRLVGFITKKFIKMHGHMNGKLVHLVGFIGAWGIVVVKALRY